LIYAIFKVPESFHTVPGANPTAEVGIELKCKQFTCKVLSAVLDIPVPITCAQTFVTILLSPPSIDELSLSTVLLFPPLIIEKAPKTVL